MIIRDARTLPHVVALCRRIGHTPDTGGRCTTCRAIVHQAPMPSASADPTVLPTGLGDILAGRRIG